MKKTVKLLLTSILALVLAISMPLSVMAAVDVANAEDVSSVAPVNPINPINEDVSAPYAGTIGASALYDVAPGTANPETGSSGMVMPGIVALLAVSTAAIVLAGKNK